MVWVDNARILAIVAVVLVHVSGGALVEFPIGSGSWWIANAFASLARWCVPVFVMISGLLLLDPGKHGDLSAFYWRRVSRLFWPIVFWSVFYLGWNALKGMVAGSPPTPRELLLMLASGKPHYHMWFLYMIVFLYLFAPFLSKVTTTTSTRHLKMLTAFMFSIAILDALSDAIRGTAPALFVQWFLAFIPYYVAGEVVRRCALQPPLLMAAIAMASIGLTAWGCHVVSREAGLDAGMYFYQYLSATVIPMSLAVMHLLKYLDRPLFGRRVNDRITSLTLGAYLVHPVILETIKAFSAPPDVFPQLVYIPALTIVVGLASLGTAWILSRLPILRRVI